MLLPSLLAASAFAWQATAFLVPLEVADAATGDSNTDVHLNLFEPPGHTLNLKCPQCPFAESHEDGKVTWTDGIDNSLILNFTIDNSDIYLNSQSFYPIKFPFPQDLYASQIRDDGSTSPSIRLGYALQFLPEVQTTDGSGNKLIPIHFTIVDLAGHPVTVDTVVLNAVKTFDKLLIVKIETQAPAPATPGGSGPGNDCTTQLCRLRAILLARIRAALDAAKARAHKAGAKIGLIKGCHGKPNRVRPHHSGSEHRPHRPNPHHKHHRGIMHALIRTFKILVIPVTLGILGGLAASAIGMILGQLIVFLWFRYGRRGRRGPYALVQQAEEGDDDVKEVVIVTGEEELPPNYEELGDKVVKADEKE